MKYDDVDGFGRYGMLDETAEGLLCHECGRRFTHLGLHAYKAHELTAAEYRWAHGLGRRGLVVEATRAKITANAHERFASKATFTANRDPARATEARLAMEAIHSPAGLEAMRRTRVEGNKSRRLVVVVTCEWCGAQFCPLQGSKRKRRFCSHSCSAKARWSQ
ncbi:hypothetical protein [Pseudactinotalea sp. Z1748]|uniref:hypothetical protein n=1 Tax=Pseudactinotalea sp. Z1748 TaxID=3413027 RepID=UPI003C7AA0DC